MNRNRLVSLANFDPTHDSDWVQKKNKSKSKSKKKIPKPTKKTSSKAKMTTDDNESLKAFEEYLLGKNKDTPNIRKSTNGSFIQGSYDSRGKSIPISISDKYLEVNNQTPQANYEVTTPTNAVSKMARDYEYLKEKIIKMQHQLDESDRERTRLETRLDSVKTENIKFISDIKVMKNEHSEIMHTMSKIERKVDQLERENWYFKSVVDKTSRDTPQSTFDKKLVLPEDQENMSDISNKVYISDNYPKTQHYSENRCTPFMANNALQTCNSSENLDQSSFSSAKEAFSLEKKPSKKRFLIPKPDSRMTADFNNS